MKRTITTLALVATMVLGTAATALAFEPPHDPQDKFTVAECTGPGIVNGHPGAGDYDEGTGQWAAIQTGNTVGAWNATNDAESNSELAPSNPRSSQGHDQVVIGGGC